LTLSTSTSDDGLRTHFSIHSLAAIITSSRIFGSVGLWCERGITNILTGTPRSLSA
jgi:hypothetical protein